MNINNLHLTLSDKEIISLNNDGKELLSAPSPLFRMRLRDRSGIAYDLSSCDALSVSEEAGKIIFKGFSLQIQVALHIEYGEDTVSVRAEIGNNTDLAVEWIKLLPLCIKPLCGDGGEKGTYLLVPYNEGAIVDSVRKLSPYLPEYPSLGNFMMFPNMVFSQFAAYLYEANQEQKYLLIAALDKDRGQKEITVRGGELFIKLYCGAGYGDDVSLPYAVMFTSGTGDWHEAVKPYIEWFEKDLPPDVKKTEHDTSLPDWYGDDVLVVSYPVRGTHDMDEPEPNALYPYTNALPLIDEIISKTGMRLLVLLMHWEGTAPWAPPYVWPPYGGEDELAKFRDELHKRNCMLGVYCSGFGFTEKSNLVKEYDNTEKIERERLLDCMCAGPDGKVLYSRICTGQRSGYDICPETEKGKSILREAYFPLMRFGIDYAQILDQNHGGAQYLCYSEKHGHPAMPGAHSTENMQNLLSEWKDEAGNMLLGCESSAAEPFMGYLRFSDCRYELCYRVGRPVPLYSYMFHEYVKNFMGNQVGCPLPKTTDALLYRIAYSFACGDVPAIILTPDGSISPSWGTRDFSVKPDKETVLSFLSKMRRARQSGLGPFLDHGKMTGDPAVECGTAPFGTDLPEVIITSWIKDDKRLLLMINPFGYDAEITINGKTETIKSREIKYINI